MLTSWYWFTSSAIHTFLVAMNYLCTRKVRLGKRFWSTSVRYIITQNWEDSSQHMTVAWLWQEMFYMSMFVNMQYISLWVCFSRIAGDAIASLPFDRRTELQMSFVERRMKSTSGIQFSLNETLVSRCILQGLTNRRSHAVNYDMFQKVCDLISYHGTTLEFENDENFIFVDFQNTHVFIKNRCRSGMQ